MIEAKRFEGINNIESAIIYGPSDGQWLWLNSPHTQACQRGWITESALGCMACEMERRMRSPEERCFWTWARIGLAILVGQQSHYPCICHDWVLQEDGWKLVKRQ